MKYSWPLSCQQSRVVGVSPYLTEEAGALPPPVNGGGLDDQFYLRDVLRVLSASLYLSSISHCNCYIALQIIIY